MKTKSFTKMFTLLSVALSVLGCSSSDNNPEDNNNGNNTEYATKLLKSSRQVGFHDLYGYDSDTLIYSNGRLERALFFGCSGTMYQFEYGGNGKVSTYYTGSGYETSDLEVDISETAFERTELEYDTNNRLVGQTTYLNSSNEFRSEFQFFYDDDNRINLVIYTDEFGQESAQVNEFDENGNMLSSVSGYSVEYDENPNPFYVLFQEYGILLMESCTSLESRVAYHLSPNNALKIFNSNSELVFSVQLFHDSDGYPISGNYNDFGNNVSDTEHFTY